MRFAAWLAAFAIFAAGCAGDNPVVTPPPELTLDLSDTPRPNREAEEAALWLSGDILASDALYETIFDDLAAIRAAYLDSIPHVAIEFKSWWISSVVGFDVTEELRQKILAHQPNSVDSLNTIFRATHMDTFRLNVGPFLVVDFEGRLHPERLADAYNALPDVSDAGPNSWIGDWSNVYPWRVEGGMSYLFRYGSGDCELGCGSSQFYYFRRVRGQLEYVGSYWRGHEDEPDWWVTAKVPFYVFMEHWWGPSTGVR